MERRHYKPARGQRLLRRQRRQRPDLSFDLCKQGPSLTADARGKSRLTEDEAEFTRVFDPFYRRS